MDKSYVTMAICPICHEETGDILMDTHLRDRFEMRTITPEPCETCREKYLSVGVLIMAPETGRVAVIKDEAFLNLFNMELPHKKIAFCEEAVMDRILAPISEDPSPSDEDPSPK